MQLPVKSFAESGLTSGPGGQQYNDRYSHLSIRIFVYFLTELHEFIARYPWMQADFLLSYLLHILGQ